MLNSKVMGAIFFSIGANLFKKSNSVTLLHGSPSGKRQAIAGIITAGSGIYMLGRSDGYAIGYNKGAKDATYVIFTIGRIVNGI